MGDATSYIMNAPLPKEQMLRRRKALAFKVWRFVALNRQMLTMITKRSENQ